MKLNFFHTFLFCSFVKKTNTRSMKKITLFAIAVMLIISISSFEMRYPTGIADRTGSPVDGGLDCSGCHAPAGVTPTVTITSVPAFTNGNSYVAGATYTLTVTGQGRSAYGLGLEILNGNTASAKDAGSFGKMISSNCKTLLGAKGITNIVHNARATTPFQFEWVAPSGGEAHIYCALLGIDGTGSTGDNLVKKTMVLTSVTAVNTIDQNTFNMQLFPNPTRDFVMLNYSLKQNSDVRICVYSMDGKQVAALNKNNQPTGNNNEAIDLASLNLKSGVYAVSLQVNGQSYSKRLLVK
jgi:hypothetical protein